MGTEAWLTMSVVAAVLVGLMATRRAPDMIVWAGVSVLLLTGVLSTKDALAGLANEGMVTVGILFLVAAGMRETGAMGWIAAGLMGKGGSLRGAQLRIMAPVAAISAFFNNTPLVAIMLPVVSDWAKKHRISVSKLLIPLSYAAILGGTCSLIGTSTNLVVGGLVIDSIDYGSAPTGLSKLGMFTITWIGLPSAIIGIVYLLVLGRKLLPERVPVMETMEDARQYTVEMIVEAGGAVSGKTIEDAGLRHLPGLYLIEIERDGQPMAAVSPNVKLRDEDRLVFAGIVESVVDLQKIRGLRPATNQVFKLGEPRGNRVLVEAVVSNTCPLVGRTIREGRFRTVYNAAVIAVARNGERITDMKIGDIRLEAGDTLLLDARRSFAEQQRNSRDFYLVSNIEDSTPPRHDRAPLALAVLAIMVVVVAVGWLSMLEGGIIAAGLMIITRCVTASGARRQVDWQVLLIISGALAIGTAIETSGMAAAAAHTLIGFVGDNPVAVLAMVYFMTMLFTELITNNAAAALVFPIAMNAVKELNAAGGDPVNPLPFVVAIMMAASASFTTPIGYQTNLMVYGPGGYKFTDFVRIGLPLNLLMWVTTVILAPLIFGMRLGPGV